jgi:hypothetical protein
MAAYRPGREASMTYRYLIVVRWLKKKFFIAATVCVVSMFFGSFFVDKFLSRSCTIKPVGLCCKRGFFRPSLEMHSLYADPIDMRLSCTLKTFFKMTNFFNDVNYIILYALPVFLDGSFAYRMLHFCETLHVRGFGRHLIEILLC